MPDTANKPARKPANKPAAADKPAIADRLAAALSGAAFPAADSAAAWLHMLASLPAVAELIAESRGHKYDKSGKGIVPAAGEMLSLTAIGNKMVADKGNGKNGKPNAMGAVCVATAAAAAALKTDKVCKAAVVFFMLTDSATLAVLHGCKATDGNGKATGPRYIGRGTIPCPRWAADYVRGAAGQLHLLARHS
jgi:hypothetical protein